jgi:hypothetical protein
MWEQDNTINPVNSDNQKKLISLLTGVNTYISLSRGGVFDSVETLIDNTVLLDKEIGVYFITSKIIKVIELWDLGVQNLLKKAYRLLIQKNLGRH